jgi:hypothetical protein
MAGLNSRSMGRSSFLFLVVKKGRKFSHLEILQLFASLLFTVTSTNGFGLKLVCNVNILVKSIHSVCRTGENAAIFRGVER